MYHVTSLKSSKYLRKIDKVYKLKLSSCSAQIYEFNSQSPSIWEYSMTDWYVTLGIFTLQMVVKVSIQKQKEQSWQALIQMIWMNSLQD